ncbi:MAG: S66 peptidase family protein [Chitinophagaceae bacterium]
MIIPPFLKPGDTIGIVCPGGFMAKEKVLNCVSTLKKWGYKVQLGKTVGGKSKNYFSGSDDERLFDVQSMLDDKNIDAIIFGRGGYGTTRILDRLDFRRFKKNPKWIVGFSDITILHTYLQKQLKISSIHGPMCGAFNKGPKENQFILSLKDALEGKPTIVQSEFHSLNNTGKTTARIIGGNLCLLAHGIGTNAELETSGKILFIEDIGEQLYNIDRMMLQLKRSGKLSKLKGLIVGGFTDNKDTERPFGKNAYEIIFDHIKEYDFPTCFGFPIGHDEENVAIQLGLKYTLEINNYQSILSKI